MKLLHTADWHLGNSFHGHSREAEHEHFLGWLLETIEREKPDALLVAGDVFDTPNPSAAAEKMLYRFLSDATTRLPGLQIVVTAGNHDSGGRLEAPAEILRAHNIYVRGLLRRDAEGQPDYDYHILPLSRRDGAEAEVAVFALPYLRPTDYDAQLTQEEGLRAAFAAMHKCLSKSDFRGLPVVVCAHFYASGAEICAGEHSERLVVGGQDRADVDVVGKNVAYVALGHIHKAQHLRQNACYAGSPLPLSFSERHYKRGVEMVEITAEGDAIVQRIDYEPLRHLVSIPDRGAALASEVVSEVEQLPKRKKGDDGLTWPYLEIRVKERQPEPTLMAEVAAALEDRAVYFCRMMRELPAASSPQERTESLAELQSLKPLEMARRIFRSRYDEEMPEALVDRLNKATELALQTPQTTDDEN